MDPASILWNVFVVGFLVILNGFFVAAEFAMVKVRGTRIDTLLQAGHTRARFAKNLIDHLDAYLSACQLGITLASLGLGWVGEPAVAGMLEPILSRLGVSAEVIHGAAFVVAFSVITALHIVIGELAPKSMAIQRAEAVTLWTAPLLIAFYKLMYPFIWLLNTTANTILRLAGLALEKEQQAAHNEEEIRILMEESHKQGYINMTELTFVDNIFEFAERNAREVMIPRTDMICLYAQESFDENLEKALEEQLTRYPVCDPDKDHIVGFVHIKDLLQAVARGKDLQLRAITRDIMAIPESMPISELLKLMQKNKAQIAIVVDEYGGTAGLVTVEDILEEIVGEIRDEFDEERESVEFREDSTYSVDGRVLVEDINGMLAIHLPSDEVDTIGGWMASQVEMPPQIGQVIEAEGYAFSIEEVEHVRINRVLIQKQDIAEEALTESTAC